VVPPNRLRRNNDMSFAFLLNVMDVSLHVMFIFPEQ